MDIVAREVPHFLQVKTLQQPERLTKIGTLGPGPALMDRVSTIVYRNGILDPGDMGCQVRLSQECPTACSKETVP